MNCASCGTSNRPGVKFCEECGARLELICAACGARLPLDKKFCGECGASLAAPEGADRTRPTAPRRFAAPASYTPPHLADRILKDRAALRGERKQVTVLFADVSGFTSISEALDPEEVHALMNQAFERMLTEIHRYEGTVNQFLGDGLMALFGAPVAHEDHGRRAALAALGMQRALASYREQLQRDRGIDFRVRMGLNTGLVVVGAIGDNLRMDYTAVGDTTNVAARMQQAATPGQVVVAEPTRRLVADHFDLRALGPLTLKNRTEPVPAWELGAPKRSVTRPPVAPLLGREEGVSTLTRAFATARGGRGQVVSLVGEAGIGKSRLLRELRDRFESEAVWLEGRCLSFGQATPFLPLVDALRQSFGIADTDTEVEAIARITAGVQTFEGRADEIAPYLRYVLSLDPGDPAVVGLDPAERRRRLFQALHQWLLLQSQARPLVLVIEDLQWIDSASEDFFRSFIAGVAGAAVLVILTYRPTYTSTFGEYTYAVRLVLHPLDDLDARRMVHATLGVEDLPEDLARLIASKAEGNPFFLEEIGRVLVETGAVRKSNGHLALVRAASTIVVPDRVQDVIAARIDRLADDQKRTIEVASVIGREFALRLLRRVAEAAEHVERALADLKALEFVYERLASADIEYVFTHGLTSDVAYESILLARRRELHARIGGAIEDLYADRLDEHTEELAHHFIRGEVWTKAARYARQAGDRAAALCVDDKAVEFYERALDALHRGPAQPDGERLGIDIRLALRAPLWRAGRLDRLIEIFREVEALATRLGETQRLDGVYSFFVQYYWAKGDQEQAIDYGRRCLEIAGSRDDLALRVTALFYLAHACQALGRFPEALEHVTTLIGLLEGPRETERFGLSGLPYCGACSVGAECAVELGDDDRAIDFLRRGEAVAATAEHLYSRVPLAVSRGYLLLHQAAAPEAIPLLESTVAICRDKKFAGQLMRALTALGEALTAVGRATEAIPLLREAVALQERAGAFVNRSLWVRALAEAYLRADQLDQAAVTAQEALGFAERHRERAHEAWARWLIGAIASSRGDRETATRHLRAAESIAAELGMRPLAGRCRDALHRGAI